MTTKEMIREHNALAERLGQAELTSWKKAKEELQNRIDAMRELVEVDAELDAKLQTRETSDPLVIDPLDLATAEPLGDAEPDQVPAEAAEETTDEHSDETERPGTIGQMVAELLVDPAGYDYQFIVEAVRREFPDAATSKRSIASVAAGLRRKGVEVPMRRAKGSKG